MPIQIYRRVTDSAFFHASFRNAAFPFLRTLVRKSFSLTDKPLEGETAACEVALAVIHDREITAGFHRSICHLPFFGADRKTAVASDGDAVLRERIALHDNGFSGVAELRFFRRQTEGRCIFHHIQAAHVKAERLPTNIVDHNQSVILIADRIVCHDDFFRKPC